MLDASAILAFLYLEPGHGTVARILAGSAVSAVNLCEVAAKLSELGLTGSEIRSEIFALGMDVVSFDEPIAYQAAELRLQTRRHGLSLGDRACLATAASRGAVAVTADRAWSRLKVGVKVKVVR